MTTNTDHNAEGRKADHIALTNQAQTTHELRDQRFNYEPLFATHPKLDEWQRPLSFLGKNLKAPLWISSMTGGTKEAANINKNLAKVAAEFGLGFGLGSCRSLLESDARLSDFNQRDILGDDLPFYANLGVAQIEQLLANKAADKVHHMVEWLRADGLIIHVNPLQEWFQPEGDRYQRPPIETITEFFATAPYKIIVKEVGQGMGPKSLLALMQLELAAIEFASFGGTNFAQMERLRGVSNGNYGDEGLQFVGHTAAEMLTLTNQILDLNKESVKCRSFIISGGVRSPLTAHHLLEKCAGTAVYAQAKPFLDHARGDYETLRRFVLAQLLELEMVRRYLTARD